MENKPEMRFNSIFLTRRDQKTVAVLLVLFCLSLLPAAFSRCDFIEKNENSNYIFQVDINSADAAELQLLPGIGDKLSQSIISYRQENGLFRQHTELQNIKGIGIKKLAAINPFLADIPSSVP